MWLNKVCVCEYAEIVEMKGSWNWNSLKIIHTNFHTYIQEK